MAHGAVSAEVIARRGRLAHGAVHAVHGCPRRSETDIAILRRGVGHGVIRGHGAVHAIR